MTYITLAITLTIFVVLISFLFINFLVKVIGFIYKFIRFFVKGKKFKEEKKEDKPDYI